ncbi:MAG TPA: hypothetical protein PLE74_10745, partial [Candidatus Cloacimonadota bacterium]|nr:hypothetical protein [Candidatus Cloacimonadota bacterium]
MKWIVLILLFTCTFPLFGYIERDCLFLLLDPSCTNQAIGDNGIGVVNPWNDTPSAAYMNPAIAAFHKGVSIEFSNSPWYKDFFDNINYRTGIIDFRFKGITFVIPSFDMHKRFGNDFDYGTQFITNESGEYFGTFNSYENAIITGFAYNPFEIMRNSGNSSPIISHFDLALGLNQIFINSHIAPPVNGLSSSAGH